MQPPSRVDRRPSTSDGKAEGKESTHCKPDQAEPSAGTLESSHRLTLIYLSLLHLKIIPDTAHVSVMPPERKRVSVAYGPCRQACA